MITGEILIQIGAVIQAGQIFEIFNQNFDAHFKTMKHYGLKSLLNILMQ